MRDTQRPLRLALFNVLQGFITYGGNVVNLYDEKKKANIADNIYIIFGTQQSTRSQFQNDCTWITDERIDIEITHKTEFEVSKDFVDDISDQVYAIVLPTRSNDGLPVQDLLEIRNLELEQALTRVVQISPTQTIISKLVTFSCQIVQQFE